MKSRDRRMRKKTVKTRDRRLRKEKCEVKGQEIEETEGRSQGKGD